MAQLIRRLGAALLAITLALLALAAPASDGRKLSFDGDAVVIQYGAGEFVPIRPSEFLPYEQKQGPPYDLLAQVTTNPSVTGDCPPGTQTVTGVTGWIGRCEERSFAVALQNSLIPEEGRGDRTPTFTRAATAYQTDFEAKQNLVLSGEARFQGARRVWNALQTGGIYASEGNFSAWNKSGAVTVTAGQTDPDGGTLAAKVVCGGSPRGIYTVGGNGTGHTALISVWLRADTPGTVTLEGSNSAGGTVQVNVTTQWKRFSGSSFSATNVDGIFIARKVAGDLDTFYVAKAQIEFIEGQTNANPGEYVSSTTSVQPSSNAKGVKYFNTLNGNTVSSNVVSEATGAPIVSGQAGVSATAPVDAGGPYGYLAEGARADVLGTTAAIRRTMTDVGWVATNMTVATTVGADGVTASGARLTATGANATILFTPGLAGAIRTYSAWIKRITGTGAVSMTVDVADGYTAQTLTSAYAQYQVTSTSQVPVVGFKIATSGDVIDVDFNTLEAATFANPTPIPVNVSKAADVLSYPLTGNLSNTAGTVYAEFSFGVGASPGADQVVVGDLGANGEPLVFNASKIAAFDGTAYRYINAVSYLQTVQKVALAWGGSAINGAINGAAGSTSPATFDGNMNVGTGIYIGNNGVTTAALFGTTRNLSIYPTALSPARAKAITTDTTEWLGSPFWRMAANDETYRIAANQ